MKVFNVHDAYQVFLRSDIKYQFSPDNLLCEEFAILPSPPGKPAEYCTNCLEIPPCAMCIARGGGGFPTLFENLTDDAIA